MDNMTPSELGQIKKNARKEVKMKSKKKGANLTKKERRVAIDETYDLMKNEHVENIVVTINKKKDVVDVSAVSIPNNISKEVMTNEPTEENK